MKYRIPALVLSIGGLSSMPSWAGDGAEAPASVRPPVTPAEWTRLRRVAGALASEETARKLYRESPALGHFFPMEPNFLDLTAKWRPRIPSLPERWEEVKDADLEVRRKEDGSTVYFLTFHHAEPANAITILKTVWRDDVLTNLAFMKGFANIPFDAASRARDLNREDYLQPWRQPSVRR